MKEAIDKIETEVERLKSLTKKLENMIEELDCYFDATGIHAVAIVDITNRLEKIENKRRAEEDVSVG